MKIEIVRKLNDRDTLIVNELANDKTFKSKLSMLYDVLEKATKKFS